MITGLLADKLSANSIYPANILERIIKISPDYKFDIKNFRNERKEKLITKIYKMTISRFKLARHFLDTTDWDSFIFIEIGLDRLQHAFWQYMDKQSINFRSNHRYKNVIFKYYQYLDFEIGTLLKRFDENTDVMVVSDHGAKAFKAGFCINQWLIEKGYLSIKIKVDEVTNLTPEIIDWGKTKLWAEGGYYARCFFNIKDRETSGIVEPHDLVGLKSELKKELMNVPGLDGNLLKNRVLFPEDIYEECKGISPDMMIYVDDLNYRVISSIGWNSYVTEQNDTGPDGANHDYSGVFIFNGAEILPKRKEQLSIYDVTPTVLSRMGIAFPDNLCGNVII
jgi:predicted AlkP superfamily phosphohydrolase/phosphomutase